MGEDWIGDLGPELKNPGRAGAEWTHLLILQTAAGRQVEEENNKIKALF